MPSKHKQVRFPYQNTYYPPNDPLPYYSLSPVRSVPLLSPVPCIPSLPTTSINPSLLPGSIVWNLLDHHSTIIYYGRPFSSKSLSEPAFEPSLPFVQITHELLPWACRVHASNERHITVSDVLASVYRHLRTNVARSEYEAAPSEHIKRRICRAYEDRYRRYRDRQAYEAEKGAGLKRIDFLMSKTYFGGLSSDDRNPQLFRLHSSQNFTPQPREQRSVKTTSKGKRLEIRNDEERSDLSIEMPKQPLIVPRKWASKPPNSSSSMIHPPAINHGSTSLRVSESDDELDSEVDSTLACSEILRNIKVNTDSEIVNKPDLHDSTQTSPLLLASVLAAQTSFIAAERALQHLEYNLPKIDNIFSSFEILQSDYGVHAGFEEDSVQDGLGYLEQIHVFIRNEVPDMSSLVSQLASVFEPFSAILYTPTSRHDIPVTSDAAESAARLDGPGSTSNTINNGVSERMPPIVVCQTNASGSNSGSPNNSGSGAESNKERSGENNEWSADRRKETNEDKQSDSNKDDGGPEPEPEPPEGSEGNAGNVFADISFDVVSEICSSQPEEEAHDVSQVLNTKGRLSIKTTPESVEFKQFATCHVEFTQLRFGNKPKSKEMNYGHFHTTVIINSQQRNADITEFKPERTLEFTRESKVTSALKTGWNATASGAVTAAITGFQATFGTNAAHSSERTTGSEKMMNTSKITEVDMYGAIEWGFHVSDHNEKRGGMMMDPKDLPEAHFEFVGDDDTPAPPPPTMDVVVSTYWSSLPRNGSKNVQSRWSLSNLGNKPFYSNVCQITALFIPSDLQGRHNYQATLRVFPRQAVEGITICETDVRRKADKINVTAGVQDTQHGFNSNENEEWRGGSTLQMALSRDVKLAARKLGEGSSDIRSH